MPKRWLYPDEWYPVLVLRPTEDGSGSWRDFTDAELADIRRVQAEFAAWQKKIGGRFGKKTETFEMIESGPAVDK